MVMGKILAIGAHFDDVEIGCGGALLRHRAHGDKIRIIVLTHSGYTEGNIFFRSPEDCLKEGVESAKILGAELVCLNLETLNLSFENRLIAILFEEISKYQPDRVYCHFDGDLHSDHMSAGSASVMASRSVPQVLLYRSNFGTPIKPWQPTFFLDISGCLRAKLKLLEVFQSEKRKIGAWRRNALANAYINGSLAGVQWAEGFVVQRFLEN